ncbi:uncharacterized protein LOC130737341 [Lotus japonicus]|uniref:uncharacterized protein LOC130737341 n=1 Tax=Lotus japonicus TaxID=34305 RepID=UPI00258B9169|nr:uncharacterized protein LOC130737341 [Lotus japonicus]
MKCSRGLKICCGVTVIVVIALLVTLVILILTVFKPKDPKIEMGSVDLERLTLILPTLEVDGALGTVVTVKNPNYGGFSYQNSTAYLYYRGNLVAEAPIHEDTIPSRGDLNITTSLNFFVNNTKFPDLAADYFGGLMNFTSTTTLLGKVKVLNLFKIKATSYSTCDLFVFTHDGIVNSTCNVKIKF